MEDSKDKLKELYGSLLVDEPNFVGYVGDIK